MRFPKKLNVTVSPALLDACKGFCFPMVIMSCAIYKYIRYGISYRDLEEMFAFDDISVDHSTLHRWVLRFSPLLEGVFRKRKRLVSKSWRMDETYIKVKGVWCYLYRAVDNYGYTIDFCLREKRDGKAAKEYFQKAIKLYGKPDKINIDKSGANTSALEDLNKEYKAKGEEEIIIRQNKYLNNIVEQDHRFIKRITRPMLGFGSFEGANNTNCQK